MSFPESRGEDGDPDPDGQRAQWPTWGVASPRLVPPSSASSAARRSRLRRPLIPPCDNDANCNADGHYTGVCLNGHCVECRDDKTCAAGKTCVAGACTEIPGYCDAAHACAAGQTSGADSRCVREKAPEPAAFVECDDTRACQGGARCENGHCVAPPQGGPGCTDFPAPHFDYESPDLRADSRAVLERLANCLTKGTLQSGTLLLTGHCDARGELEFNMSLGDNRAQAVKTFIVGLGVPADRIRTSSRGSSTPWARTRRAGRTTGAVDIEVRWTAPRDEALTYGVCGILLALGASGCGLFVQIRDFDALKAKDEALAKQVEQDRQDLGAMKADSSRGTRERLENALRANADTGSDLLSSKARINDLAGRADELAHSIDELKKLQQDTRNEVDTKLDALTRQQAVEKAPAPPPVQVPADKETHFQSVQGAYTQKDWPLVRTLGHEYVVRYPTDDRADDVQFLLGDADLEDSRPTSALGEFNRLLKVYPRSDKLDKTLFAMGDAYMQLHDCVNAKLAYGAVEQRFGREKIGQQAKQKVGQIDHPAPGMCAPQP